MIEKNEKLPTRSFLFIRHGETDYNAQNICMGQLDIELNERGKRQAEQASEILANYNIDLIYHSFLKRTRQTAEIINHNKIEMQELQGIEERNCGSFQGLNKNEIKKLRTEAGYHFFPDNAETDAEFTTRIYRAFNNALNSNLEKNILFVSHGGVFKALLNILNIESFEIKNCEIVEFIVLNDNQNSWKLEKIT